MHDNDQARMAKADLGHRPLTAPPVSDHPTHELSLFEYAVQLARREAATVIGTITPETPWGVDPRK